MQVNTISVGALHTNCYILRDSENHAVIVDPGDDADRILRFVRAEDLKVQAIWLTHGHFDHIGAADMLRRTLECPVAVYADEVPLLADPQMNLSAVLGGIPMTLTADITYKNGETFTFGGETVRVLHTPGHTGGSCCYLVGDLLFAGDTLFAGSVGRTDFPTSDMAALFRSLQKLAELPGDYTVLAGHGPATTLQTERMQNPYMAGR